MAKAKKKKSVAPGSSRPSGSNADYWRERLPQLVARGRLDEAAATLERFWPPSDPVARISTIVVAWPARLAAELPESLSPAMAAALAPVPLVLDDVSFAEVLALPAVAEHAPALRALRDASVHLCRGELDEARAALQTVGVRSPLRDARMLLRALCSLQEGADDDASRALTSLRETPFARVAARLTAALDGEAPDVAKRLGLVASPTSTLDEPLRLLRERKPNEALAAISKVAPTLPPPILRLLRRQLPAALLARGVESEAIPARLERALRADPEDPSGARLRAILHEKAGCACCRADSWIRLAEQVRKGKLPPGLDRRQVEAAILTKAAGSIIGELSHAPIDGLDEPYLDDIEEARDWFDTAIRLDVGRRDAWEHLREILEELDDRPALTQYPDDLAAAFPDDPDALLTAATMCSERKALTKAAAHARRAATLAPDDPRVRDVEAEVLMGRAAKCVSSKRLTDGRKAALAAADVRGTNVPVRRRARALAAVFEHVLGSAAAADALRARELAAGTSPWEWEALVLAADAETGLSSRARGVRPYSHEDELDTWPEPSPEDVTLVLRLASRHADDRPGPSELFALAGRLAERGTCLTDTWALFEATRWCNEGEARMRLLEYAVEIHPINPLFMVERWRYAMSLGRPAAYFVDAEADLRRLLGDLETVGSDHDSDLGAVLSAALVDPVEETIEMVRAYVRGEGGGSRPGTSKKKPRGRKPRARASS